MLSQPVNADFCELVAVNPRFDDSRQQEGERSRRLAGCVDRLAHDDQVAACVAVRISRRGRRRGVVARGACVPGRDHRARCRGVEELCDLGRRCGAGELVALSERAAVARRSSACSSVSMPSAIVSRSRVSTDVGDRRRRSRCRDLVPVPSRLEGAHEAPVDLEEVDRQLLEVREGRVAGAEVVHADVDADVPDPLRARRRRSGRRAAARSR